MSRDSQTDSSRDGNGQLRMSDPDVMHVNADPFTLAEEKHLDPDAPGTASDYRGTTAGVRANVPSGMRPRTSNFIDQEDR